MSSEQAGLPASRRAAREAQQPTRAGGCKGGRPARGSPYGTPHTHLAPSLHICVRYLGSARDGGRNRGRSSVSVPLRTAHQAAELRRPAQAFRPQGLRLREAQAHATPGRVGHHVICLHHRLACMPGPLSQRKRSVSPAVNPRLAAARRQGKGPDFGTSKTPRGRGPPTCWGAGSTPCVRGCPWMVGTVCGQVRSSLQAGGDGCITGGCRLAGRALLSPGERTAAAQGRPGGQSG